MLGASSHKSTSNYIRYQNSTKRWWEADIWKKRIRDRVMYMWVVSEPNQTQIKPNKMKREKDGKDEEYHQTR